MSPPGRPRGDTQALQREGLPVNATDRSATGKPAGVADKPPSASRPAPARILVIEDNSANLELVRYLLCHAGHTVLLARNGLEGLSAARAQQPDLIICDLQMPGLDGYQVLAELRADPALAGRTVVAVTAFSMPNDRERVMTAGFDGYVSKPIEPETFVAQMEAFLPPATSGET